VLPVTEKELRATLDQVRSNNPQVAAMLDQVLKSGGFKRMNFFAIDMHGPAAGVNHNVNVNHASVDGSVTSQQVLDDAMSTLQQGMPGFKVIESKAGLTINKLDAARLQYDFAFKQPDGSSLDMRGVQFYMLDGSELDVVTVTGPPTAAFLALAERIGNSFSLDRATLPTEQPEPAALASPAPTEAALPTGVVTHGGNLRSSPKIAPETVVGLICPDDQVAFLEGRRLGAALWYRIQVTTTTKNCDPKRVAVGTEGWVNSTLLSAPSAPVTIKEK
jgi:hypothetical protein